MKILIYKATFPDGRAYIGMTSKSLKRRICQHISDSKQGSCYRFHEALRIYRPEKVKWKILKITEDFSEAKKWEMFFIKSFKTKLNGFNSTLGGQGVLRGRLTSEQRINLAKARGTAKPFYVYRLDGTFVSKFESLIECVLYFDSCGISMDLRNLWACLKGLRRCSYGFYFSYKNKFKLKNKKSKAIKLTVIGPTGRKKKFKGLEVAAKELGISSATIRNCMRKNRPTRKGLRFYGTQVLEM